MSLGWCLIGVGISAFLVSWARALMRVYQLRLSISGCVDQRVNFAKFIPCVWQKCLVWIELGIDAVMAMILRFALHLHVVSPLMIGEAPNSWVVAGFIEFMTRPLSPKQATLKNTTRPCSHHRRSAAAPGSRRRWWRCCATGPASRERSLMLTDWFRLVLNYR